MMEVLIWEGTERWRKSGGDGECGVRVKEENEGGNKRIGVCSLRLWFGSG